MQDLRDRGGGGLLPAPGPDPGAQLLCRDFMKKRKLGPGSSLGGIVIVGQNQTVTTYAVAFDEVSDRRAIAGKRYKNDSTSFRLQSSRNLRRHRSNRERL